jgi:Domain of unknown function (DUF5666)
MPTNPTPSRSAGTTLPRPADRARWRWAQGRRAAVGGGVLAAVLSLGTAGAGAATTTKPPAGPHGRLPSGDMRPTAAGRITALSGHDITIDAPARGMRKQVVTYSNTTTFRKGIGSAGPSALKVGEDIVVMGTRNSNGSVTARSIMVSPSRPARTRSAPKGSSPPRPRG